MRKIAALVLAICLFSCTSHSEHWETLERAEDIIQDKPEEALSLLNMIDGQQLGSRRMKARYALIYSQALYRNYIDAPNDSLISFAADYYEEHGSTSDKFYAYLYQGLVRYQLNEYEKAAQSLIFAMENSSSVNDHYAIGQMYANLSLINLVFHCSDALDYAMRSYASYSSGGLQDYAANALVLSASSHLQNQRYDSCRCMIEKAITEATRLSDTLVLNEAKSVKAQYAICVDSTDLAEELLLSLSAQESYVLSHQDISNLAYISAYRGEMDSAHQYLQELRQECHGFNDSILYYTCSYWVNRLHGDFRSVSLTQDTLLALSEKLMSKSLRHTSIASQREYAESQLVTLANEDRVKTIVFSGLTLLSLAVIALLVLYSRNRNLKIQLLQKQIEYIQAEKAKHSQEYEVSLKNLLSEDLILQIREMAHHGTSLSFTELTQLHALFREHLPHFEQTLRKLISMSDIEWHICMLLKISFTPGEISVLLNKTPGAISSARIRMYGKVFNEKGRTTDWDSFVNSL